MTVTPGKASFARAAIFIAVRKSWETTLIPTISGRRSSIRSRIARNASLSTLASRRRTS